MRIEIQKIMQKFEQQTHSNHTHNTLKIKTAIFTTVFQTQSSFQKKGLGSCTASSIALWSKFSGSVGLKIELSTCWQRGCVCIKAEPLSSLPPRPALSPHMLFPSASTIPWPRMNQAQKHFQLVTPRLFPSPALPRCPGALHHREWEVAIANINCLPPGEKGGMFWWKAKKKKHQKELSSLPGVLIVSPAAKIKAGFVEYFYPSKLIYSTSATVGYTFP